MRVLIHLIAEVVLRMSESKLINVELQALDNNPITPRTGKGKVTAQMTHLPIEGNQQNFIYVNEDCESPGVRIETNGIERLGNELKFYDYENRAFKITLL